MSTSVTRRAFGKRVIILLAGAALGGTQIVGCGDTTDVSGIITTPEGLRFLPWASISGSSAGTLLAAIRTVFEVEFASGRFTDAYGVPVQGRPISRLRARAPFRGQGVDDASGFWLVVIVQPNGRYEVPGSDDTIVDLASHPTPEGGATIGLYRLDEASLEGTNLPRRHT